MILACQNISKAFGTTEIIKNASFHIEEREKAAIVGVNGAGKTTLFKVLTGEISADGGEFYLKKDASLGYLAQNIQIDSDRTIYEEMLSVFEKILQTETNLRELENEMGNLSGQALAEKMEEYATLQHYFEQNDGYSYQSRLRGVLKGLGFADNDFNRPMNQLSGGQKTRVHLAKLLLSKPKDELLWQYGILRCGEALFQKLESPEVLAWRKKDYSYDVLVPDREAILRKYPEAVIDQVTMDEILLLYVKGVQGK